MLQRAALNEFKAAQKTVPMALNDCITALKAVGTTDLRNLGFIRGYPLQTYASSSQSALNEFNAAQKTVPMALAIRSP